MKIERFLLLVAAIFLLTGGLVSSGSFGLSWRNLEKLVPAGVSSLWKNPAKLKEAVDSQLQVKVASEESLVIGVVEKVSPSVVTVGISKTRRAMDFFEFDPFDPFSPFQRRPGSSQKIEQDIGSGFIIGADGLIVTNKHVVGDSEAKYRVITKDDKTYDVVKIYRDPGNDLAILKISASGLPVAELGDSSKIKVGQMAIAIGTALGEFRHTVTTGVISGIGRGITAGSPFAGAAERLDNVIQTDAAINPGNSGGPLLNSAGQVIGVNTAVSAEGQNIGFALPINVVKEALNQFNSTGQFNRPFLGIRYKVVTRDIAILNDIPEGCYVMEIIAGSPADQSGLQEGDIIIKIDNDRLSGQNVELAQIVNKRKVGEKLNMTVYRENKEINLTVTLGNQDE